MCLGIPGRLIEFSPDHPDMGRVDVEGLVRDINLGLLEDDPALPGDWVLIHLGFALQKMTQAEVDEARSTLTVLGEGGGDGALEDPFGQIDEDDYAPAGYGGRPS